MSCQCRHELSDSNSWTVSTDVGLRVHAGDWAGAEWPECQSCECCQIVVSWYWMLCHTQYINNLAWNVQWSGTASVACLCTLPLQVCNHSDEIESLPALGLSALMCFLKERCKSHRSLKQLLIAPNWQECVTGPDCVGVEEGALGFVSGCSETYNFAFMAGNLTETIPCWPFLPVWHLLSAVDVYLWYQGSAHEDRSPDQQRVLWRCPWQ